MNNRQRQLLAVCLASMGFGLLGGLVFSVTSQMIRPGKVDLDQAIPEQSRPTTKGPALPSQDRRPFGSDCVVPPGGGPPVTKDFKPC